ncbi:hypothetical protein Pmani_036133 [Petrolisthes manimaculis]|uniref:Uncharacterized protein n=1 Tax=Petrolisthes manimaculis TaxID=1843537 RepID=A0AAE1NLK5_9EUCA|nr:hypothetical protein Pmani_036133 [Petrolisthes manimaculis]
MGGSVGFVVVVVVVVVAGTVGVCLIVIGVVIRCRHSQSRGPAQNHKHPKTESNQLYDLSSSTTSKSSTSCVNKRNEGLDIQRAPDLLQGQNTTGGTSSRSEQAISPTQRTFNAYDVAESNALTTKASPGESNLLANSLNLSAGMFDAAPRYYTTKAEMDRSINTNPNTATASIMTCTGSQTMSRPTPLNPTSGVVLNLNSGVLVNPNTTPPTTTTTATTTTTTTTNRGSLQHLINPLQWNLAAPDPQRRT